MRFYACAALVGIAVMFGGGGSPSPLSELIVELSAIAILVIYYVLRPSPYSGGRSFFDWGRDRFDWALIIVLAAFVAIPMVQLIPLPASLWALLPGRSVEAEALALVGNAASPMPLSVEPSRTLASLLSLIPPMIMLYLVAGLPVRERTRLLLVVAGFTGISILVGAVQLSSGTQHLLRFYPYTHAQYATGFQANRNAQADVLSLGLIALASYAALRWSSLRMELKGGAVIMGSTFVLAIFLTGSRAGIAASLVPLAMVLFLLMIGLRRRGILNVNFATIRRKVSAHQSAAVAAVFACVLMIVSLGYLVTTPAAERTIARFSQTQEGRPDIWQDTIYAINLYWPIGSGLGTFVPVFDANEPLEHLTVSTVNRAHNEYLEFALEAGIAGLTIVIIALLMIAYRVGTLMFGPASKDRKYLAVAAGSAVLVIGLHSVVDYPMRTMSLAVLMAFYIAVLCGSDRVEHGGVRHPGRRLGV